MRFLTAFLFTIIVSCLKLSAQATVNDNCSGATTVVPGSLATPCSCATPVSATNTGTTQSLPACTGTSEDVGRFKIVPEYEL